MQNGPDTGGDRYGRDAYRTPLDWKRTAHGRENAPTDRASARAHVSKVTRSEITDHGMERRRTAATMAAALIATVALWQAADSRSRAGSAAARRSPSTRSTSRAAPSRRRSTTCSKEANGRYSIEYNRLPTDADQQRELVVRRLAAEDSDIDIVAMDVIWTAEFAEAGWILPWEGDRADARQGGQARRPAPDRGVQRPALGGAVHHEHAAPLVPQGPRQGAAQELHLGRHHRHRRRERQRGSRCRRPATRATRSGSTR